MVIDYASHGLADPKGWSRPACKVYNVNRAAGSFYYEPMLEYIDRKGYIGADVASKAVQMHAVQNRKRIEFPNAHEAPRHDQCTDTNGPLRLSNFLVNARAKQMKQRNTKTVHVRNEIVRQSKSTATLVDKRTSTMIRDQYINQLSLMYTEGVGRMASIPDAKY